MVKEEKSKKSKDDASRDKSPKRSKGKRSKSPKRGKSPKNKSSKRDKLLEKRISLSVNPDSVLEYIPEEYLDRPETAEPMLHFLPKMVPVVEPAEGQSATAAPAADSVKSKAKFPNLKALLAAAEDDIRLHRARVQAAKEVDVSLLRSYKIETDPQWEARQARLKERKVMLKKLDKERGKILKELLEPSVKGLTAEEMTQVQLARWQRALELYVYAPPSTDEEGKKKDLEFMGLLEKLLEGVAEEQDMSVLLSQAADMCNTLVDVTKQIAKDATEQVTDSEDVYQIRLEAHELFSRNALARTEEIQNQFRINGRAATQIGNQLEFAESKRKRCETASTLIRRWWLMESTAEQEAVSGEELRVQEEVRGAIPLTSCRMDPLFTQRENSLEASRTLKQLRQVVRSRSGNTSTKYEQSMNNRFNQTADLINRTSMALEQRMLNDFSEGYGKGGVYEFIGKQKKGHIEWRNLRDLAQALLSFENGRTLHERYVNLVVSTRIPELFDTSKIKTVGRSTLEQNKDVEEFDIEATRSQLNKLFSRLSEVIREEFQLIAHVFETPSADEGSIGEIIPLKVARALCTRVIGDPKNGLQSRINNLLDGIDRSADFDAGSKKLDTFVVIHEKASELFGILKEGAGQLVPQTDREGRVDMTAADSLKAFLNSQQVSLNNNHRHGYLNLELRMLHHQCCSTLDQAGCVLKAPAPIKVDQTLLGQGVLQEYRAPLLPIDKTSIKRAGFGVILSGPLKQSVLRQPLLDAADALARARVMFGVGKEASEASARVFSSIYTQMCDFYGQAYLYPICEALQEMLKTSAPFTAPQLPFNEDEQAHDMGVNPSFWVSVERIQAAAKSFDRELWAENRKGSLRVWELLSLSGEDAASSKIMSAASQTRLDFFDELEGRGEDAILRALDTLKAHIQWILVSGSESMLATGGARLFNQLSGQSAGPYAMSSSSALEAANSPAVKSLCYCLRVQFVQVQNALNSQSLSSFWTALSMRMYDILVARLLEHWYVSTIGAVLLNRDVEALRSVAMLAGTNHEHWDTLRELLTLYMTPPDNLRIMLLGPEGDGGGGLFQRAGREQSLVFMSRRIDYRYKTGQGLRKSVWATQLLEELKVRDPSDGQINIGLFAAGRTRI